MPNKKSKSPLTIILTLLAFVLSSTTPATAIENGLRKIFLQDETVHTPKADATIGEHTIWTTVKISSSVPSVFQNQKENEIDNAALLTPIFDTLCYSGRPLRVLHLGDSHVAGKIFPQTLEQQLDEALGKARNDSLGTGIHFDYKAENGATAFHFLTSARLKEISDLRPDLIILSFGTNECHGMGYRETDHERALSETFDSIQQYCPQSVILLTTPPGDCLTRRRRYEVTSKATGKKYRRYHYNRHPNPMSVRCARLIADFGENNHLPVWNLNNIAGGSTAVHNWTNNHLMRKDHIHFTPEGYRLQGRLLSEALLKAYNHYIITRNNTNYVPSLSGTEK